MVKMPAAHYIIKRLIQIFPVVIGMITLIFILIHLAPGDPITYFTGESNVDPQMIAMLRERFGLNRPLIEQYSIYLTRLLQGDLGYSFVHGAPVVQIVLETMPNTLLLIVSGYAFATLVGIFLGAESARKPYSKTDKIVIFISLIAYSIPGFLTGFVLIYVFSYLLGWLPMTGMVTVTGSSTGIGYVIDLLRHLALPAIAFGAYHLAFVTRLTRGSVLEALSQDYITTARSKGLSKNAIIYKHALRNALLPVTTVVGLDISYNVGGAIIIETLFSWPGVGRLMFNGITDRDYPLLLGSFFFLAIAVVLIQLFVDILYTYLDPRIRYK